jgi:hypothetical protein
MVKFRFRVGLGFALGLVLCPVRNRYTIKSRAR